MPADGCDRQCQTEKAQGPEPCASDDPTKGVGIEVCRPLPDHECCGGEAAAKMSSRRIRRIASVIGPQTSGMSAAFARAPLIRYHRSADIFSEECVHVSLYHHLAARLLLDCIERIGADLRRYSGGSADSRLWRPGHQSG